MLCDNFHYNLCYTTLQCSYYHDLQHNAMSFLLGFILFTLFPLGFTIHYGYIVISINIYFTYYFPWWFALQGHCFCYAFHYNQILLQYITEFPLHYTLISTLIYTLSINCHYNWSYKVISTTTFIMLYYKIISIMTCIIIQFLLWLKKFFYYNVICITIYIIEVLWAC